MPVWLVALGLAAAAPVIVRAIDEAFRARLRKKTLALIATARAHAKEGSPDAPAPRREV